ncbi:exocyst complex component Sec6-domain-containing protein [Peziza echinospora]|nr:exocyst complex component Sec6-domain-containing protein [Peziza echinospora]
MDEIEVTTVKLSELLRHTEDLDKIGSLKAEFARKKAVLDAQIKSGLKQQLQVTEAGLGAISDGQRKINTIKEEMMKIEKLCVEAQNMIQEFPLINKISKIHRNFVAVEDMKSGLQGLDTKLSTVDRMLQDDDGEDIMNPMPNLIPVHHQITQIQDFRDNALHQSSTLDQDIRHTLESYFSPLLNTVDTFDERIGIISMNMIELVRAGNVGLVVRLAKIIDAEERSDEKVLALQAAQNSHQELASRFKSIQTGPKVARGYKQKWLDCIKSAAAARFNGIAEAFIEDPDTLSDSLQWFFDDLRTVQQYFPQLMPPKWNIFETYLNIYHGLMHDFLKSLVEKPDLDGGCLLKVILWNTEYTKNMKALGIKATDLTPRLLDGKEDELVKEYLHLIVNSMEKWMDKIIADDTKDFINRPQTLEYDENKNAGMPGAIVMFQMINQQIEVALDSNKGSVVAGVVDECVRMLKNRQNVWQKVMKEEVEAYCQNPDDAAEGILEYSIAVANDQLKCAGYAESTSAKTAPLLSRKFAEQVTQSLDSAIEGYVATAEACIDRCVDIIFQDLKPAFALLFTPSWYGGEQMSNIIATIRSYLLDPCEQMLNADLFIGLVENLSEVTLQTYLSAIRNKGAKLHIAEACEQIRNDVVVGYQFFTEFLPPEQVKASWSVLEYFMGLISEPKDSLYTKYEQFKEAYWDLSPAWVEAVVKAREDSSRDLVNVVKKQEPYVVSGKPTIMGKVK